MGGAELTVRSARLDDAAAVAAIYAPFVRDSATSFEELPPTEGEMRGRIADTLETHPYLIAARAGGVVGYAYASPHRARAAYRWAVEVSVYVGDGARHGGVGRALYTALFSELAERGFHVAFAGITLPNEASIGLHAALGFVPVGVFREAGYKFGRWHDVGWYQRLV